MNGKLSGPGIDTTAILETENAYAQATGFNAWCFDFYTPNSIIGVDDPQDWSEALERGLLAYLASSNKSLMKFWVMMIQDDRYGLAYPTTDNWKYLDDFGAYVKDLTDDPQYLRIDGKPVIGLFASGGHGPALTLARWQQFLTPMGGQNAVWVVEMSGSNADFTNMGCQARFNYGIRNLVQNLGQKPWSYLAGRDDIYWTQALLAGESRITQLTVTADARPTDAAAGVRTWPDSPTQVELYRRVAAALGQRSQGSRMLISFWNELTEEGLACSPTVQEGTRFADAFKWARDRNLPTTYTYEVSLSDIGLHITRSGFTTYVPPFNTNADHSHNHDYSVSKVTNEWVEMSHEKATRIVVYCRTRADAGIVAISLDGGAPTLVDLYEVNPGTEHKAVYDSGVIAEATHTIRLTVNGTKNGASTDFWVYADSVAVTYNPRAVG